MKKFSLLTAAVLALSATSAFAQDVGRSKDIVGPNNKATEVEAPAPTVATTTKCSRISVRVPSFSKSANFVLTILDDAKLVSQLDALKACNSSTEVASAPGAKQPGHTMTVKLSQGVDKWAHFKVPTDTGNRLMLNYTHLEDGKQIAQWSSNGVIGDRDEIVLEKPATAIQVGGR